MQASLVVALLTAAAIPSHVQARAGLAQSKNTLRATVNVDLFQKNLRDAVGDMLGCGEGSQQNDLDTVEKKVLPIWNSLPKSATGRIERPLLRYIVYRYFMGASSLVIRGFEQSSPVNESADILSQQVPAYVEAVLQSQHSQEHGFDLQDTVHVVAMLRKLIADSDAQMLETIYNLRGERINKPLKPDALHVVLRDYLAQWLMYEDQDSLKYFQRYPGRLDMDFPHWHRIMMFRDGMVKTFDYKRRRAGKGLTNEYSFSDVQEIISDIRSSFANFWDHECNEMRTTLVNMDSYHTGRVPLKMFYSKPFSREWRFAESEDYLRHLGALDETSTWHGKEVIIPNYIGAASNCAVITPHYYVCCADLCDSIFRELEASIGGPVAPPEEILDLVGNMSNLEDEENPRLRSSLARQLDKIAAKHGGLIPLHGRLFAQWLHYAFPRECAFPHKSGSTKQVLPKDFGGQYVVQEEDRLRHLDAETLGVPIEMEKDAMQWMSQWSAEEELMSDYTTALRDPSSVEWLTVVGVIIILAALAAGAAGAGGQTGASKSRLV
jgi:hypothetical protein